MQTNRIANLRFIRKDPSSGVQGCPSISTLEGGHHLVVGRALTDAELADAQSALKAAGTTIGEGEIAVFVPRGTIEDAGS